MRIKWWLLLGAAVVVGGMGVSWLRAPGADQLVNQVWIERLPRDARDMIWHFVPVEKKGRRLGALGRNSRWRIADDWFVWKRDGDRIEVRTPQNGCVVTPKVRVWDCAGQAPRPFELCLELTTPRQSFRYYSRKDWRVKDAAELPAALGPLVTSALAGPATPDDVEDAPAAACTVALGKD